MDVVHKIQRAPLRSDEVPRRIATFDLRTRSRPSIDPWHVCRSPPPRILGSFGALSLRPVHGFVGHQQPCCCCPIRQRYRSSALRSSLCPHRSGRGLCGVVNNCGNEPQLQLKRSENSSDFTVITAQTQTSMIPFPHRIFRSARNELPQRAKVSADTLRHCT